MSSLPRDHDADAPSPTTLVTYWTRVGELEDDQADHAWDWFVDRYRGFVRDVLRRLVGAADAEAATDDFWSYLFTSGVLGKADRSRRLRAFMVGVLRRFAHDWRRQHPRPRRDHAEPADLAPVALPERQAMRLWATRVLLHALADLADQWPRSAEVLCLFYGLPLGGNEPAAPQTVTQIAGRIGINPNAIHQTLFRGRQRLRGCLEAELSRLVGPDEVAEEIPLLLEAIDQDRPGLTHG